MAAVLAALAAPPAAAEFRYVAPEGARPSLAVADDPMSLARTLRRMAPALEPRFDRRVDAGRRVTRDYPGWRALLWGEGLAWTRRGGELHVRPAGIAPGDADPIDGAAEWKIAAGETLRDALERWGARAGIGIVWLTDLQWRLHETRTFRGTFAEAARTLLFGLSHLPRPPAGELRAGSLAVTHRLPPPGDAP